jgi:hypothetical protein
MVAPLPEHTIHRLLDCNGDDDRPVRLTVLMLVALLHGVFSLTLVCQPAACCKY